TEHDRLATGLDLRGGTLPLHVVGNILDFQAQLADRVLETLLPALLLVNLDFDLGLDASGGSLNLGLELLFEARLVKVDADVRGEAGGFLLERSTESFLEALGVGLDGNLEDCCNNVLCHGP